jgi:hypothetical protein
VLRINGIAGISRETLRKIRLPDYLPYVA